MTSISVILIIKLACFHGRKGLSYYLNPIFQRTNLVIEMVQMAGEGADGCLKGALIVRITPPLQIDCTYMPGVSDNS